MIRIPSDLGTLKFLYVGITNPDPALTKDAPEDPNRSQNASNPFTYYERLIMLRDAMVEFGVPRSEFEVVPFPINQPHLIRYYTPPDAVYFVTIYDQWGRSKASTLSKLGLTVDVMWERELDEKSISGTEVRRLIAEGGNWQELVPKSVASFLIEHRLVERIATLHKHD